MSLGVSTQKPQGNSGMKKIIIRAPRIIKEPYDQSSCKQWYKVIYYDGEKNVKTWFANTLGVDIAQGLQDLAFKDKSQNKGTIMRKDAVKMLQEVFSRHGDLKEFAGSRNRSSRQYGGILASVKALFDLYIDEQKFLLKKIDAYNNLTNKYITYKQIDDKTSPRWLKYRKYCKDNNITINKDSYLDYIEQQRVECFIEACDKDDSYQHDPALTYMYEKIYLDSIPDSASISPSDKEKLKKINEKYGVKIIIPTSKFRKDKIDYIEREFENWESARRSVRYWRSLRLPPTINLLKAQKDYIDDTSAYGGSKSSAYCCTDGSGKIAICGYENIEWALRHELMHCADWKRLEKFPDSWYEADGKTIKSKIKSQLYNEFKKGNLNIKNKHFDYAFNNPREFIAVAAEGDIRKYSKSFIDLLIEFGMPNWAVNLRYNY